MCECIPHCSTVYTLHQLKTDTSTSFDRCAHCNKWQNAIIELYYSFIHRLRSLRLNVMITPEYLGIVNQSFVVNFNLYICASIYPVGVEQHGSGWVVSNVMRTHVENMISERGYNGITLSELCIGKLIHPAQLRDLLRAGVLCMSSDKMGIFHSRVYNKPSTSGRNISKRQRDFNQWIN